MACKIEGRYVLNNKTVILKSIECIKKVINKLDSDTGEFGGVDYVLSLCQPNDVISAPEKLLDKFILYLFCVYQIDWYSENWSVRDTNDTALTVRPEPGLAVYGEIGEDQEVSSYCRRLQNMTDRFIQVFIIYIFVYKIYIHFHNML